MPPALDAAFTAEMAAIAGMGPEDAAVAAGELTAALGRMSEQAAAARTSAAAALRDGEGLSLAQLAERLGVHRGTAQKVLERDVRRARRANSQ